MVAPPTLLAGREQSSGVMSPVVDVEAAVAALQETGAAGWAAFNQCLDKRFRVPLPHGGIGDVGSVVTCKVAILGVGQRPPPEHM